MDYLKLPFFSRLEKAQKIVLAGAGGGFDIFCGLPLYFGLRAVGKEVYLANLSFSAIHASNGKRLAPALVEVNAETWGSLSYFPEIHLSRWFKETRNEDVPVYCFENSGVAPVGEAYRKLVEHLGVDAIVLVDGGTDSLMRGDEVGLGTPNEDIASLLAVSQLETVPTKLLVCLGFGVDTFHGVCHAHFLQAVAELTRQGGFLGGWTLTQEMNEVRLYQEASRYVFEAMPDHPSIVSSSVLSAIEGQFGDYHATHRTFGSQLFINPLMTIYWCFEAEKVAGRILYRDAVINTQNYLELSLAIKRYRTAHSRSIKPWVNLPM